METAAPSSPNLSKFSRNKGFNLSRNLSGSSCILEVVWRFCETPRNAMPSDTDALQQQLFQFIEALFKQTQRGFDGSGCGDRKSTRLNSSHSQISYAVF